MNPRPLLRSAIVLVLANVLLASLAVTAGAEGGLGVSPTRVDFGDVVRDEPIERTFRVQNGRDEPATVTVAGDGGLAEWVDVIGNRTVPAHGSRTFTAILVTPPDAANGVHQGNLTVTVAPRGSVGPDQSGMDVALEVRVALVAQVGGPQRQEIVAGGLHVPDVEVGSTIPAVVTVRNTGNVRATPTFLVTLTTAQGEPVAAETITAEEMRPGSRADVTLRVPAPAAPGQYRFSVETRLGNATVHAESALFDVLEDGALRRKGEMGALVTRDIGEREVRHRLRAGDAFLVSAPFENTGDLDVDARLTGYITRDGRVVRTLEGDPVRVAPGESVDLRVLVTDVTDPGRYVIVAHTAYAGKVTPESEAILTLEGERPGSRAPAITVLAAVGVLVVGGGIALATSAGVIRWR